MNGLWVDFKLALRVFAKSPAFAGIVVLTLALGSGANTAIFSLLDQVMLRLLPLEKPYRLVVLSAPGGYSGWTSSQSETVDPVSQPMYEGLRDRTPAFSGVLADYRTSMHVTVGGETENASGDLVVLGNRYFQRRFGGDAGVVGRTLSINGHPMTVIGVAPPFFDGVEVGASIDLYVPLSMQQEVQPTWGKRLGDWRSRWLTCVARLKDGVSVDEARAAANVVYRQLVEEDCSTSRPPRSASRSSSARSRSSCCRAAAAPPACAINPVPRSSCSWAWSDSSC